MLNHNYNIEASDIFGNYATFGPLFVSIKVSDCISPLNLFLFRKRPACAVCTSTCRARIPFINHAWVTQKVIAIANRVTESSELLKAKKSPIISTISVELYFLWVPCGKLWCWLCVCWWLGFSPWMTQHMGWSCVVVSSSVQSSSLAGGHDGDGQSVQVRGWRRYVVTITVSYVDFSYFIFYLLCEINFLPSISNAMISIFFSGSV